jgi:PAS domain S-box-containing protein
VSHKAERRESEGVLRRSEERFRALVETSPEAVVIVDGQGTIDLFNAEAERVFGYARSELIGNPVELLIPERFRSSHVAQRAHYLDHPHARPLGTDLDLFGLRKDGSEFPADISLSAIQTDEGQLVVSRVRDTTEARRVQERQRTSESRFAALLESAPDGVAIIDQQGTIVQVNEQTEHLFGYTRAELLGKPIEMLLPDRFHEQHVAPRADYLAVAGKRRDGTEFSVDVSLTTTETGEGRMMTAFIRDITERQAQAELERHLAERHALIDRLEAAGEEQRRRIADDIHDDSIQVITAAGMRLQILRRKLDDPEHIALLDELEQTIQLSISRLRHLLFELRPPALDNEGLSAALEMYIDEAGRESKANYRLDDKLMSQPDERTRLILYRIAQEAIANVGKHAEADNVTVFLRDREGGYLVQIADDGVGFSPEEVKPVAGHLGLTAMRERATLAGGWLRIDAAPGEGTTVEAWIPTRAEELRQEGAASVALHVA